MPATAVMHRRQWNSSAWVFLRTHQRESHEQHCLSIATVARPRSRNKPLDLPRLQEYNLAICIKPLTTPAAWRRGPGLQEKSSGSTGSDVGPGTRLCSDLRQAPTQGVEAEVTGQGAVQVGGHIGAGQPEGGGLLSVSLSHGIDKAQTKLSADPAPAVQSQ